VANWKHIIPVKKFFPSEGDMASQDELSTAGRKIYDSLIDNRAFLRYVELPEDEIDEFSDIADDFWSPHVWTNGNPIVRLTSAEDFDEAMERLYDWADKNLIWID
jgi:hypothetical protein